MRSTTWKGFDYVKGVEVELPRADWRARIEAAPETRRICGDLLIFERTERGLVATAEVYDKHC